MRALSILLTGSIITTLSTIAAESAPDTSLLKTTPRQIAVFKNGLGFVARSGEAKLRDGVAEMDTLPSAALGALWFATGDPSQRIHEVSASRTTEKVPVPVANLTELLRANIGEKARIFYAGGPGGTSVMDAEIVAVPEDRSAGSTFEPVRPRFISADQYFPAHFPQEPVRGEIVILRDSAGQVIALNRHSVQSVQFEKAELETTIDREKVRTRLRLDPRIENATVNLHYLQEGWNWSPSYLVDISNDKEASLTLEAVLANDVEDIENAEISFVVGYPNFAFSQIAHPLSSPQTIAGLIQSILAHGRRREEDYGIISQNSVAYSDASVSSAYSPAQFAERQSGQGSEDLFFFRRPSVTLSKGGRARFTLISAKVPYEHIYEWRLGGEDQNQPYRRHDQLPKNENEVWHTLRIKNATQTPFTTAPVLAINGQLPVAQDTLKYTPPNASSSVRVTVASDVRAKETLTEISREPVTFMRSPYVNVTVQSALVVRNYKSSAIKVGIHRSVSGEILESAGANVNRSGRELNAQNPSHDLLWEFELPAGEEKAIEFRYSTLAPR